MTIRLGVYAMPVDRDGLDYVIEAERLGVDSAWVPEFWGYDALTGLGAAAAVTENIKLGTAIVQLGTRTPAMLAMSATPVTSAMSATTKTSAMSATSATP